MSAPRGGLQARPLPTFAALAPLFDRQGFGQTRFALDVFQQAVDAVDHILAVAQARRISDAGFQGDEDALQAPDFPGQDAHLSGDGWRAYSSRMRAADIGVGGGR